MWLLDQMLLHIAASQKLKNLLLMSQSCAVVIFAVAVAVVGNFKNFNQHFERSGAGF